MIRCHGIQFFSEIPPNLGSNECLAPRVRDLVIMDYLMSRTAKNVQVTNLFCDGSHHRNLSVITLNQNLYFGRYPTQRKNMQYLVIFKNPIDYMPIQMLSRQMYPTNLSPPKQQGRTETSRLQKEKTARKD